MTAQENAAIVQKAYEAFGKRDIATLVGLMSDDIDWEAIVGAGPSVPTRGRRKGPKQVEEFFHALAASTEFKRFEPREFIAERDKVVVLGFYEATAKNTGRSFATDWVMVFTVRNGKIVQFREYTDVISLTAAY
jgi:ketosteroid isomerase-like protein